MRGIKKDIEAAGARLVFIGNGATPLARGFKETSVPDCEVLTDPSTASYALLGARRGAWAVWSPRSWPAGLRAVRGGFRQSRTQGQAYLLGGVAILDSDGVARWTYVSRYAGDHPNSRQILAALKRAVREPAA